MTNIEQLAERAWLQQTRKWEREGLQPGQFTAFIEGFKFAVEMMMDAEEEREETK